MIRYVLLIPAQDEEKSIAKVLNDIPKDFLDAIVVVNNGSIDKTKEVAIENGAIVVDEMKKGYGKACLSGIDYIRKHLKPDVLIFMDGDYSDYPEDMLSLTKEIENGYDLVLGSRTMDDDGKKGLSSTNQFGNKLAAFFLKLLFKANFTDLGPFRAIKFDQLLSLNMCDENYGWTIEMQIKAIRKKMRIKEIPVRYRTRYAGVSKVTGSLKGSVLAFSKITYMFFVYFFKIK